MSASRARVLVVVAETLLVKAYDAKLTEEGFDVKIAHDGDEAVADLAAFRPDAILIDLALPYGQGFETLARLHAEAGDTPLIVLSENGQEEDVKRAASLGAQDYFIKADHAFPSIIGTIRERLGLEPSA